MRRILKGFAAVLAGLVVLAAIIPLIIPIPPLEDTVPPEELADVDSRFMTAGGVRVHYKQVGTAAPSIFLLHGFGASAFSWREVMTPLARYGTVVAYDRPAFGLTERPMAGQWQGQSPYGTGAQVEMLIHLMDGLGAKKAILVGHSAGGTIAALAALRHPDRVAGLVLVAPAFGNGGPPSWVRPFFALPQVDRLGPLAAREVATSGNEILTRAWHDPSRVTPAIIDGYRKPLKADNWDRALWLLTVAEGPTDLQDNLERITTPTLVVTGDDDRIVPTTQTIRNAARLPKGKLVIIPLCGHLPQEEQPDAFMRAAGEFISSAY